MADAQEEILNFRVQGGSQVRNELEQMTTTLTNHRRAVEDYNRVIATGGKPTAAQNRGNVAASGPSGIMGPGKLNYADAAIATEKLARNLVEVQKAEEALATINARKTGRPQMAAAAQAAAVQAARNPAGSLNSVLGEDLTSRQASIEALLSKAQRARSPQGRQKWTQQAEQEIEAVAALQDTVYSRAFPDSARKISNEVRRRAAGGDPMGAAEFANYRAGIMAGERVTPGTDPDIAEALARTARGEVRRVPHKDAQREIDMEARRRRAAGTPFTAPQFEAFEEETNKGKYVSDETDPYLNERMEHAGRNTSEKIGARLKQAYSKEGLRSQMTGFSAGYAALNLGDSAAQLADAPLSGERYTPEAMQRNIVGLAPGALALLASPLGPGASLGAAGVGTAGSGIFNAVSEKNENLRLITEEMSNQLGLGGKAAKGFSETLTAAAAKTSQPLVELAKNVLSVGNVVGTLSQGGINYQTELQQMFGSYTPKVVQAETEFAANAPLNRPYREMLQSGNTDRGQFIGAAMYEAAIGNREGAYTQLAAAGEQVLSPYARQLQDRKEFYANATLLGFQSHNSKQREEALQKTLDDMPDDKKYTIKDGPDKAFIDKFLEDTRDIQGHINEYSMQAGTAGVRAAISQESGTGLKGLAPAAAAQQDILATQRAAAETQKANFIDAISKAPANAVGSMKTLLAEVEQQIATIESQMLGSKNQVFRTGISEQASTFTSVLSQRETFGGEDYVRGRSAFSGEVQGNYQAREAMLIKQAGVESGLAMGQNTLKPEERASYVASAAQKKLQALQLQNELFRAGLGERTAEFEGGMGRLQIGSQEDILHGTSAFGPEAASNSEKQIVAMKARAEVLDKLAADKTNFLRPEERERDKTDAASQRLRADSEPLRLFQAKVEETRTKSDNRTSTLNVTRSFAGTQGSHIDVYKAENKLLDEQMERTRQLGQLLNSQPLMPLQDKLRLQTEINNSIAQEVTARKNLTEQVFSNLQEQAQTGSAAMSARASRLELTQGSSAGAYAAHVGSFKEAQAAASVARAAYDAEGDPKRKAAKLLNLENARQGVEDALMASTTQVESPQTRTQRNRISSEMQRQQMSIFEPGAPITGAAKLNTLDTSELRKIQEKRADLRQRGMLTAEVEERLVGQEEPLKTGILERQNQMNFGWMDRLTSMSVNSASFTSRIMPAPSDIAALAENKGLGSMSARVFGYYGGKSYDDSAAMGMLPSDIGKFSFGMRPGDNPDAGANMPFGMAADGGSLSAPIAEPASGLAPGAQTGDTGMSEALNQLTAAILHGLSVTVNLNNPTTGQQQAVVVNTGANQSGNAIIKGGDGHKASSARW